MADEITPPEKVTEEVVTPQTVTPEETPKTPPEEGNGDGTTEEVDPKVILEKAEDYKRKLKGSTEEALRLKQENELLKKQLETVVEPKIEPESELAPEDLETFKKFLKASGVPLKEEVVTKQEKIMEAKQAALDNFMATHPEYAKEENWQNLLGEIRFYREANTPLELKLQLEKAHKVLANDPTNAMDRGKAIGLAQARLRDQANLGSASAGGSTPTPKTGKTPAQQYAEEQMKLIRPQYYQ